MACLAPAQEAAKSSPPASAALPSSQDPLGRSTPRGTVVGFLNAARKNDDATAARYLNTRLRGEKAEELAHQLAVVMNQRLPAKLNELSDQPEGSRSYANDPTQELVGSVASDDGDVEILLQRMNRGKEGLIWLFASSTLTAIPDIFPAVEAVPPEAVLPAFLVETRFLNIPLFQWLVALVGLPLIYLATTQLDRWLGVLLGHARRRIRHNPQLNNPELLPGPVRILVLAMLLRWGLSHVMIPLLARQFWSSVASLLTIAGVVWLVIRVDAWCERRIRRHLAQRKLTGTVSILRFARRATDVLIVIIGVLFALHHLGVNVGAAVAGLGVGGIAVALAAQKTLENVIGGMSLVIDQAVRVGDFLKIGDTIGTVDQVGLRSTRILTNDRTIVSIPNGQIATASVENFSLRDKFWFHHTVGLSCGTTLTQLRDVLSRVPAMLAHHHLVEYDSVRVRLLRFGPSSLRVELFAYVKAVDFPQFLQVQEELLLRTMELIQEAGTHIAIPSHALYIAGRDPVEGSRPPGLAVAAGRSHSD